MPTGIQPASNWQTSLFRVSDHTYNDQLMEVVDALNKWYGRGTVFFAASGIKPAWAMQQVMRSPWYTTRWDELPQINIR